MAEPVRLVHIDEFRVALKNYEVSPHAHQLLQQINIVALSGVAGGGRNTIINYLTSQFEYHFLVSDTTRPPKLRNGTMEVDGINYFFRTEEQMLQEIRDGEFLEAEVIHNQQVSGTSIRELERAKASGKIPIAEVEFGGIENIHHAKPDTCIIGVLPPSYNEWITRFRNREDISDQEFHNRLETARSVLDRMLKQPYFKLVVNDNYIDCAARIRVIVETGEYSDESAQAARTVAQKLQADVKQTLNQAD